MPSSRAVLADIIEYNLNPNEAHQIRKKHLKKPVESESITESIVENYFINKDDLVSEASSISNVNTQLSDQPTSEDKKEIVEQNELLVDQPVQSDSMVTQSQVVQKKRAKKLANISNFFIYIFFNLANSHSS